MTPSECAALVGKPVKVRRLTGTPGFHTARLDAVCKDEALVMLKDHKHHVWVPISSVRRWLKAESMQAAQRKGR